MKYRGMKRKEWWAQKSRCGRPILGRVTVHMDKFHPGRMVIKDPEKFERWIMLSKTELGQWDGRHGIKVERYVQ